jgi:hypothetical protein
MELLRPVLLDGDDVLHMNALLFFLNNRGDINACPAFWNGIASTRGAQNTQGILPGSPAVRGDDGFQAIQEPVSCSWVATSKVARTDL